MTHNLLIAENQQPLAIPGPAGTPAQAVSPLDSMTYFDLVGIAWHRKPLFVLGIVVALIGGALYYARTTPKYESSAEVLVIRKRPEVVTGDQIYASGYADDYLSTHAVLIKSPVIIERAIESADLGSLLTFSDDRFRDPTVGLTTAVTDLLSVGMGSKEMGRSADNILTVSFRGPVPDECGVVVRAILASYQDFLEETYRSMGEDTMSLIGHARDDLQNDLQAQEEAYRVFREKAPLVSNGTTEVNPRTDRLAAIETQISELLLREADFESQLENLRKAKEAGRSEAELTALVSQLANRADVVNGTRMARGGLDGELFALMQEEQKMRQDYGPNHPLVVSVRQRIEATRSFFTLPNAAYQMEGNGDEVDPVKRYEGFLEQELAGVRVSKQLLTKLYENQLESAKQLSKFELQNEGFQRNMRRTQLLYDGVVSQLQGASLVRDYGGFDARIIAPAALAEKVTPKALIVFPAAVFLGSLLGCLMVFTAEASDRRFRSAEEIKRYLGYPIIGQLSETPPISAKELRDSRLDRMLYAFHKPTSTITEAFRGVRTALYFSTRGQSHKIIQITSSGAGDGKSTLASNLAVCIAQSGKSVLLVDADLRRPRMHKVFAVPNDIGLASVIGLDVELSDAVTSCTIPNLSILPSGQVPPDPSELLSSHRFTELMEVIREQYDYVLIDSGPILAVTDPSIVASRVDGVVMAVRITQNSRTQAKRAQEILSSIGSNVLGVFVIGARDGVAHDNYAYYQYQEYLESPDPELTRTRRRSLPTH